MSWIEIAARGALVSWMVVTQLLIGSHRKRLALLEQQQKHTLQLFEIERGERATAVVQWAPASPRSSGYVFAVKIRREDGSIEAPPPYYADCDEPAPVGNSRCCRGRGHPGDHYASPVEGWPQKGSSRT